MKMQYYAWICSWILLFLSQSDAHVRWVCPRPQDSNTGIKSGPCSAGGMDNFTREYMDITPGPMTILFEESIVHAGAPTIVWLRNYDNPNQSCLLLDHVPHNDAGEMGFFCITGWPIGNCPSQNYLTIKIPDIECERCYLQIISVMLDKYGPDDVCRQIDSGNNNCSTYYTCANIKIRPTSRGQGKEVTSCSNYNDNLMGTWPNMYPNGIYSHLGIDFTPQGWMNGTDFVGPTAGYWRGVESTGPCAPETRRFGGVIKNGNSPKGTLSFAVTEDRMKLTGAMGGLDGSVSKISMTSSNSGGVPEYQVPLSVVKSNKIEAMLDIKEQAKHVSDPNKFMDKVTISHSGTSTADLEEVMTASVYDMVSYSYYGEALVKLLRDNSLHISFTVNGLAATSIKLHGPARRGMEGPVIADLTSAMTTVAPMVQHGEYRINLNRHPLGPDVMMYLWNELLYIKVGTADQTIYRDYRGQVSRPGAWHCPTMATMTNTCFWLSMSVNGQGTNNGEEILASSGYASVYVDAVVPNRVHYRVFMQDLGPTEKIESTSIFAKGVEMMKINATYMENVPVVKDKVLYAKGYIDGTNTFTDTLKKGDLELRVKTSRFENITGKMPPIEQNKCTKPMEMAINWMVGSSSLLENALVGDELVFTYSGTDTVEKLNSQADYDNCNFGSGTVVGGSGQSPVRHEITSKDTLYIASRTNCAAGLKMKIMIYDGLAADQLLPDSECSQSLYSAILGRPVPTTGTEAPLTPTRPNNSAKSLTYSTAIIAVLLSTHLLSLL